jgi:hypothetical protein
LESRITIRSNFLAEDSKHKSFYSMKEQCFISSRKVEKLSPLHDNTRNSFLKMVLVRGLPHLGFKLDEIYEACH